MPNTKNFQKRITILDECFSYSSGLYTLEKLGNVLEEKMGFPVARKTIQNDIKYIKERIEENISMSDDIDDLEVFVKGIYDGKKKAFRYVTPNYSLGNQLLSKSDKEQLEETLAILSRYRNRADFNWLDELFPRIESSFNLAHEDYNSLISYQSNRDYTGQSMVGKLYNQLLRKKVLNIEYRSFKEEKSHIRTIHPYHLKQYNNRWFLFGYQKEDTYTGITNLALDRIISFTETTQTIEQDTIDWGDYFDDIIGVSKNKEDTVLIKLRFRESRIKYVDTKPIHGATQKTDRSDPNGLTRIIKVIPNKELYQTLLSFGKDVEVLEPDFVKNELKNQAQEMLKYYTA